MDGKTILPRSEVPEEFTWDLSHVFASDDKWNKELEALKAYPERMAAYAGKLGESAKTLLDWFTLRTPRAPRCAGGCALLRRGAEARDLSPQHRQAAPPQGTHPFARVRKDPRRRG